jgi:predicted transcriptional regulator
LTSRYANLTPLTLMYCSDEGTTRSNAIFRFSIVFRSRLAFPLARMTRGRVLSEDLRQVVVRMRRALPVHEIMRYTGVTRRTIERILSTDRSEGRGGLCTAKPKTGRKRTLTDADFKVSSILRPSVSIRLTCYSSFLV